MATPTVSDPTVNGASAVPESDPPPAKPTAAASDLPPSSSVPETALTSVPPPETAPAVKKWPGWPGDSVFRLIVPVLKVGSIIGKKGELIKRMCEETRARIRILEGAVGTSDRVVLISGKEELDAPISPAMDAVLRVFKRVSGISETEADVAAVAACSIRLLVASSQAVYLIGKQGSVIKSIQEGSGASVRVLPENEVPFYASPDERIIDIQGEYAKVLKALELVIGHLRKFLVDHSVLPLFEKAYNATSTQDRAVDSRADRTRPTLHAGINNDFPISSKRDSIFDREAPIDTQLPHPGVSMYGQDPAIGGDRGDRGDRGVHSSGIGRAIITQVTQTMRIPLTYAEDIIGIRGTNIAYIRRTSGAILTIEESFAVPDEITVEIKGTSSQVQTAQQLIEDSITGHSDPLSSSYGKLDTGLRSYSHLPSTTYSSASLTSQSLGGYGGGYSSYRM